MDTTKTITHISLCAGYGGIDIGLKRAIPNLRTICFSEIEAFPIANLVSKMEKGYLDTAPIWTDIKTFPWKEFRGVVDIVSGGFPCQPFSAAGKRNADTDERHLFPYILQGIRECQPSLVFLENVEGIISSKLSGDGWRDPEGTPVLLHVLRELERVGYKATAGIFSASEVGAPHQRKRVFIMAYNDSNGSGQSRLLQQRADGSVIKCNGESWGVELAHSKNERCRGRSDRNRNNSRGFSEQETQLKSVLRGEVEGCCGDTRETMANSCNCADSEEGLCQEGSLQAEHRQEVCARVIGGADATIWPSRPGQPQHQWEPPRVVSNPNSRRLERSEEVGGRTINVVRDCGEEYSHEAQSKMGRDLDGPPSRMVLTELYTTNDSRNDELRLLGNGVVPQTCTKAFIILFDKLMNEGTLKEEQGTLNI